MDPLTYEYFSTVLHELRLVESADVEPLIQRIPRILRADYKLYRDFRVYRGSVTLTPYIGQGSTVFALSNLVRDYSLSMQLKYNMV